MVRRRLFPILCAAVINDDRVWLAADDQLVVNHDPTFKGKRMENSPSTALTAIKLDNGESLPTLAKYLKAAQPLHTRLILELKAHIYQAEFAYLCTMCHHPRLRLTQQ